MKKELFKIQSYVGYDTKMAILEIVTHEKRSESNVVGILISEALSKRQKK